MVKIAVTAILALFLSGVTLAGEQYTCTNGPEKRSIDVVYPEGGSLPCEVRYRKNAGQPRVLWSAQSTEGYCADMADEFVSKQETLFHFDCKRRQQAGKN